MAAISATKYCYCNFSLSLLLLQTGKKTLEARKKFLRDFLLSQDCRLKGTFYLYNNWNLWNMFLGIVVSFVASIIYGLQPRSSLPLFFFFGWYIGQLWLISCAIFWLFSFLLCLFITTTIYNSNKSIFTAVDCIIQKTTTTMRDLVKILFVRYDK